MQRASLHNIRKLIDNVANLNIRMILMDLMDVENQYRNIDETPKKEIEAIIENVANLLEMEGENDF